MKKAFLLALLGILFNCYSFGQYDYSTPVSKYIPLDMSVPKVQDDNYFNDLSNKLNKERQNNLDYREKLMEWIVEAKAKTNDKIFT